MNRVQFLMFLKLRSLSFCKVSAEGHSQLYTPTGKAPPFLWAFSEHAVGRVTVPSSRDSKCLGPQTYCSMVKRVEFQSPTEERLRNLSKPTRGCHLGGRASAKTRGFHTQLDEGPETP